MTWQSQYPKFLQLPLEQRQPLMTFAKCCPRKWAGHTAIHVHD